jgi:N-acetylglutamate synthase-like GNAT family acetyltransferase
VRLRRAREEDVAPLLALINGYADRGMLLRRSEESLRSRLEDFTVAVGPGGEVVGCGALTVLGPGLGEVRSLAVREDHAGRGIGRSIVEHLLDEAGRRGFDEVLALTRRPSFFEALGFSVTRRERFLDKLMVDCKACPMNLCCDETAMVRVPPGAAATDTLGSRSALE